MHAVVSARKKEALRCNRGFHSDDEMGASDAYGGKTAENWMERRNAMNI